jgi:hypothetical protein
MTDARTIVLFSALLMLGGCNNKQIFTEPTCSADSVNESGEPVVTMKGNGILRVAGWAADKLSKQAPDTITVNLVSPSGVVSKVVEGKPTVPRPDVKVALNAPAIGIVGFGFSGKIESLAPGVYEIQLLQNFPDRILVCKSAKSIRID